MSSVVFAPAEQLDLRARKLLAARLLRLIHDATMAPESDDLSKDDLNYLNAVEGQLDATMEEDDGTDDFWSLITFLNKFGERVERFTKPYDEDHISTTRAALIDEIARFDCDTCGNKDFICKGGRGDELMFADDDGARCLRFLADMINSFVELADAHYREIADDRAPQTIVPKMVLETHRKNGSHGTLAIDGEFVQPTGEQDAVVKVFWPIDEKLDDAILSLPYLVFHEVFVHGAQGAGRQGLRFAVEPDCAFTEGGVDAVACDVLLDIVLPDEDNLPEVLRPLATEFYRQCQAYHTERFEMPDRDSVNPGDDIRRARTRGRDTVLVLLTGIASKLKRPKSWAHKIILLLNLYLDAATRTEFYRILNKLKSRSGMRVALVDPLDQFIEDHDADALMARLRAFSPLKRQMHKK